MNKETGELRCLTHEEIKEYINEKSIGDSPWVPVPKEHQKEAQSIIESSSGPAFVDSKADTPLSKWARKIRKPNQKAKAKSKRKTSKASRKANRRV